MITREQRGDAVRRAKEYLDRAGIVITAAEERDLEVADFGLGELERHGLEIVVYVNTDRCCAKELVLFPGQTCPEHRHPPVDGAPGKEETFRCRWGTVMLYVPGPPTADPAAEHPPAPEGSYTVAHEVILRPGDQYTLMPDTLHWFTSGPEGAVVSEFSTRSRDDVDVFTDQRIKRAPEVVG
jgi:D-lyxose ketol-isomerase